MNFRLALAVGIFVFVPYASHAATLKAPGDQIAATQNNSPVSSAVSPAARTATSAKMVKPTYPKQSSSINIPAPPPPSNINANANDLAAQAEQAALQAQTDAESAQAQREEEHNRQSFKRAETGVLPLSPDQIRVFMHRLEQTQKAAQPPFAGPPHGQVRISTLSLDPGAEPPQIHLVAGYVTTINILDATGQPWPILDVGVGGNFEVSPTAAGTHIVRVMPLTRVGTGDLSVLLKDLPTPIIFRLSAGGRNVDLRFDARIPKFGPNAKIPLVDHPRLEAGNKSIMMILEDAPPSGAKRVKVSGLDSRTKAWALGNRVYVRTPLTLLSPAWNASVTSGDGMTVYEIGNAPVLLMSDNGAIVRARLSRGGDHDQQP